MGSSAVTTWSRSGVRRTAPRWRCSTRRPVWLEFVDHQYLRRDERAEPKEIAVALAAGDRRRAADRGVPPDGAREPRPRRRRTTPACCSRRERDDLTWFCYEDSGYKHIPGMLAWRVAKLFRSELWPTPMVVPVVRRPRPQACRRSSATGRSSRRSIATTRWARASAAACPSSSGCSRRRRPVGSGCGRCDDDDACTGARTPVLPSTRSSRRYASRRLRRRSNGRRRRADERDRGRARAVHRGDRDRAATTSPARSTRRTGALLARSPRLSRPRRAPDRCSARSTACSAITRRATSCTSPRSSRSDPASPRSSCTGTSGRSTSSRSRPATRSSATRCGR